MKSKNNITKKYKKLRSLLKIYCTIIKETILNLSNHFHSLYFHGETAQMHKILLNGNP